MHICKILKLLSQKSICTCRSSLQLCTVDKKCEYPGMVGDDKEKKWGLPNYFLRD